MGAVQRNGSRGWGVIGALLALIVATPCLGDAPPVVLSGQSHFALGRCDGPFTVRFISPGKAPPVALRTGNPAPPPGGATPRWSLRWDGLTASDATIHEYSADGHFSGGCPGDQPVTVPVQIRSAAEVIGSLTITITGGAPKLWVSQGAFPVLTRWPFSSGGDRDFTVRMAERSHSAPATGLTVWADDLKRTDTEAAPFRLALKTPPLTIPAGAAPAVTLHADGPLPPGVYSGSLFIAGAGDSDADDLKTIPLTLKVRIHRLVLFAILFCGVLVGLLVNTVLTQRVNLGNAKLLALRAVRTLLNKAAAMPDEGFAARYTAIADQLEADVGAARTVADVTAAQAAATTSTNDADAAAAALTTSCRQEVAVLTAIYDPLISQEPAIAGLLAGQRSRVRAVAAALEAGKVTATALELRTLSADLAGQAFAVLRPWLAMVAAGLQKLGPWPAGELATERLGLIADTRSASVSDDAATVVPGANAVAARLRVFATQVAPMAVFAELEAAAAAAGEASPGLRDSLLAQAAMADGCVGLDGPTIIVLRLAEIRGRAAATVLQVSSVEAVATAVDAGDFVAAVAAAVADAGGQLAPVAALMRETSAARVDAPPAPGPIVVAPPSLITNTLLKRGQSASAKLIWPAGQAAKPAATWTSTGDGRVEISGAGNSVTIKGVVAGFATLTAGGDGWSVSTTVSVADPVAAQVTRIADETRWLTLVLGVVTVCLTTGVGYTIFAPAWLGTFNDGFSALLWGAFGQFGLDRVRTASQAIVSKTPAA